MKSALIIRHHPDETMGEDFASILAGHGYRFVESNIFDAAPRYDLFDAPSVEEVDLVMAFGGPMSARDSLPALTAEGQYMLWAMESGKPVFAVCLGAQVLAAALGSVVEPTGGYQFGLRKINVTAEGDADPVFGAITVPLVPTLHGECFSIPSGATRLAECHVHCRDGRYRRINMAFRYGNSYAFQFEPQLTLAELQAWDTIFAGDYALMGEAFDPAEESALNLREFAKFAPHHRRQMNALLEAFLANAGLG